MTSLRRKLTRAAARRNGVELTVRPQYVEPLPNGGYRTLHPRKGWRIVSPKRLKYFA